jgi:hypothetical protein
VAKPPAVSKAAPTRNVSFKAASAAPPAKVLLVCSLLHGIANQVCVEQDDASAVMAAAAVAEAASPASVEAVMKNIEGLSVITCADEAKDAHVDERSDSFTASSAGHSATMHKKTERIKEMEQEIFDLKKRLERSESRVVRIVR